MAIFSMVYKTTKNKSNTDEIRDDSLKCGKKLLNAYREVCQNWDRNKHNIDVNIGWFDDDTGITRDNTNIDGGLL